MHQRLSDSFFLEWISSTTVNDDFKYLDTFLNSKSSNCVNFLKHFLSGETHDLMEYQINILKGHLEQFYIHDTLSESIQNYKDLTKNTDSLKILRRKFEDVFEIPYWLNSIFFKNILHSKSDKISDRDKTIIYEFLDEHFSKKTLNDLFYFVITGDLKLNYIEASRLYISIDYYFKHDSEINEFIKNGVYYSPFINFVIVRLLILFDPQKRNRIEKRNMNCKQFITNLSKYAVIKDFKVLYDHFRELLPNPKKNTLNAEALTRYEGNRISREIADRYVTLLYREQKTGISFTDFSFFIIHLEDKSTLAALHFWFKICDLDDDDVLSISEFKRLYKIQKNIMKINRMEVSKFKHILPQILDMLDPSKSSFTITDVKKSNKWDVLFDLLLDSYGSRDIFKGDGNHDELFFWAGLKSEAK